VTIYIKEAHTVDEWQMNGNERDGVCYLQPKTFEGRVAIARDFIASSGFAIPMLVDHMENRAEDLYASWPERLYIVDEHGTIAFKGDPGPTGFDPAKVERWLETRFQRTEGPEPTPKRASRAKQKRR
jgi:hypothetical protein